MPHVGARRNNLAALIAFVYVEKYFQLSRVLIHDIDFCIGPPVLRHLKVHLPHISRLEGGIILCLVDLLSRIGVLPFHEEGVVSGKDGDGLHLLRFGREGLSAHALPVHVKGNLDLILIIVPQVDHRRGILRWGLPSGRLPDGTSRRGSERRLMGNCLIWFELDQPEIYAFCSCDDAAAIAGLLDRVAFIPIRSAEGPVPELMAL